jgi:hypothetical protein
MPSNINMQQLQKDSTAAHRRVTAPLRRSGRKSPGTRAGTFQDWREGSNKYGKSSAGIGKTLRDGR